MTLLITMIRPGEGVWQSADFRVSDGRGGIINDVASKQLSIHCPPHQGGPKLLLAFTGLAVIEDGTPTLRWIRETLRGETRDINETLRHLRDRLTRDVGRSRLWRQPLILAGGILEASGRTLYVAMTNVHPTKFVVVRTFELFVQEVDVPLVVLSGSGKDSVGIQDRNLLAAQTGIRPAKWEDHLGLLAAVNRRAATRNTSVSPWCHASFMSVHGDGISSRVFQKPDDPGGEFSMDSILFGVDTTSTSAALAKALHDPDFDLAEASKRAAQESVEGRP